MSVMSCTLLPTNKQTMQQSLRLFYSPNSVLSLLSRKTFPPIFWTTTSQEYWDLVQHMMVARMESVAKTLASVSDLTSFRMMGSSVVVTVWKICKNQRETMSESEVPVAKQV